MKKNGTKCKVQKTPAFAMRAERALKRAANNVKAQHRAFKVPVIVWKDGKVISKEPPPTTETEKGFSAFDRATGHNFY